MIISIETVYSNMLICYLILLINSQDEIPQDDLKKLRKELESSISEIKKAKAPIRDFVNRFNLLLNKDDKLANKVQYIQSKPFLHRINNQRTEFNLSISNKKIIKDKHFYYLKHTYSMFKKTAEFTLRIPDTTNTKYYLSELLFTIPIIQNCLAEEFKLYFENAKDQIETSHYHIQPNEGIQKIVLPNYVEFYKMRLIVLSNMGNKTHVCIPIFKAIGIQQLI